MEHDFKIGDIVQLKGRTSGAPGSPDLTVIAIGPQSVSVACYDEEARLSGTAQNFNGTYFHGHLKLIAGTNTEEKANRKKNTAKSAAKKGARNAD